jgi:hypothetical protein
MRFTRNRLEARWLPSRYDLSLCRLYAYLRLSNATPVVPDEPHMFAIDRHQNVLEVSFLAIWCNFVTIVYLSDALSHWLIAPVAILIGALAAPPVIHLLFFFSGICVAPFFVRGENHVHFNSRAMQWVLIGTSIAAARLGHPFTRAMALLTLLVTALNFVAMVIVFFLRHRIAQLEKEYEGDPASEF